MLSSKKKKICKFKKIKRQEDWLNWRIMLECVAHEKKRHLCSTFPCDSNAKILEA